MHRNVTKLLRFSVFHLSNFEKSLRLIIVQYLNKSVYIRKIIPKKYPYIAVRLLGSAGHIR